MARSFVSRYRPPEQFAHAALLTERDEYVTSTDFQRNFGDVMRRVAGSDHAMIITVQNRWALALVSFEELARLRAIEREYRLLTRKETP